MTFDPCLPVAPSAATLQAWKEWRLARPGWHAPAGAVRRTASSCHKPAALILGDGFTSAATPRARPDARPGADASGASPGYAGPGGGDLHLASAAPAPNGAAGVGPSDQVFVPFGPGLGIAGGGGVAGGLDSAFRPVRPELPGVGSGGVFGAGGTDTGLASHGAGAAALPGSILIPSGPVDLPAAGPAPAAVPEPSSAALLIVACVVAGLVRVRRSGGR